MNDVWTLESKEETMASEDLNFIIESALEGEASAIDYLENLWNESWSRIKSKLAIEGSVWYVWYMDGVRHHLNNILSD